MRARDWTFLCTTFLSHIHINTLYPYTPSTLPILPNPYADLQSLTICTLPCTPPSTPCTLTTSTYTRPLAPRARHTLAQNTHNPRSEPLSLGTGQDW